MADNSPFVKDWFTLGFVSGAGASVVKSGLNYLISRAGMPTTLYGSMASSAIFGREKDSGGCSRAAPRARGTGLLAMWATPSPTGSSEHCSRILT